jgi:hypothetical protein
LVKEREPDSDGGGRGVEREEPGRAADGLSSEDDVRANEHRGGCDSQGNEEAGGAGGEERDASA